MKADNRQQANTEFFNISELLYALASRWYLFVISLLIATGVATYKIATTQPTYTRYCEILVKSSDNSTSLGEYMANFANLGLRSTTNAYNEIYTLRTPEVMTEVARRLNLKMRYESEGRFHPVTLYDENLPVTVEFYDLDENSRASLTIEVTPQGAFTITDISGEDGKIECEPIQGVLNDGIALAESPLGKIIVRRNGLQSTTERIKVKQIGLQTAAAITGGSLSFGLKNGDDEIIVIKAFDTSVERADDILSTIIDVYNGLWIKDKNKAAEGTYTFIEERLENITEELENIDSDISSYKSRNLLPATSTSSSINTQKSRTNLNELQKLNNNLAIMRDILKKLQAADAPNEELPLSVTLNGSMINNQIAAYNKSIIERDELFRKSGKNNPVIKELDEALLAKREAIIAAAKTMVKKTETQIATLEKETKETLEKISKNPEQTKYLASAEREQSVKESLYLFLLQKREENRLSQAFTAYKTRVITPPTGSVKPTAPIKKSIYTLALAIGLAIPAALVILRELSNTRIRGRKDLESLTAPIIGEIPQYNRKGKKKDKKKKKKSDDITVVVEEGNRNIINEAFRVLRTNIEFITREKSCNTITVTSFNPGSGKTFCILNTAISLAIKGEKVILIDGDMRHASLSQYVNSPANGLSTYLAGTTNNADEVILTDKNHPTLHIIAAGTTPPNPTELLETKRFAQLMEKLQKEYKFILIDCPPIDIVADTHIIEKFADRTIFLVRAGIMEREMVADLEDMYRENKLKNMSVILNGVDTAGHKYGYRYSYRYGYHNGRSYSYGQ